MQRSGAACLKTAQIWRAVLGLFTMTIDWQWSVYSCNIRQVLLGPVLMQLPEGHRLFQVRGLQASCTNCNSFCSSCFSYCEDSQSIVELPCCYQRNSRLESQQQLVQYGYRYDATASHSIQTEINSGTLCALPFTQSVTEHRLAYYSIEALKTMG